MIPSTYAEWLLVLDKFSEGDDSVIEAMIQGKLEWTNVVAERWTRQVSFCLSVRLRVLSTQLQIMLDRSRDDYFGISNALLTTRRGLTPLRTFVGLPVFPDDVKEHLVSELDRWARETQNSLETHAANVRHDQGRLLKTIRDQPLTAIGSAPPVVPQAAAPGSGTNPSVRGRRVIF